MSEGGTTVDLEARVRGMMRRRDFDSAIALLVSELERDGSDGDLVELLGMAYFFSGQHELARETFEKLTRSDPMRTNAWVNLGAVLNRLGHHKLAADALRRALQRDRKCAIAYYNLGIAQRSMNQNTMAISAYKEAVKLRPEMTDANMNLGKIYLEMNNYGLAAKCFNAVLKHDPESRKARMLLDKMHKSQKDARKSKSPFGRLVDQETLAAAQVSDSPRTVTAAARNDERDLCRKLSKEIRSHVKAMVPRLDQTLHSTLQKLAVGSLQGDSRSNDLSIVNLLAETRLALLRDREEIVRGCTALRNHLRTSAETTSEPSD